MTRWKSPLKVGMVVECEDDLVVKIVANPRWNDKENRYSVRVLVLEEGSCRASVGYEDDYFHKAPDRFGGSIFRTLHPPGTFMTLEEEFFERKAP